MLFLIGINEIKNWEQIANFILNENDKVFRTACRNINDALYEELKNVADWAVKNRKKAHVKTTKTNKYGTYQFSNLIL